MSASERFGVRPLGVWVEHTLDQIEADAVPSSPSHVPLVGTGLADVDFVLGGGLRPGQLVVVAGRPGAGASTLARCVALNAAVKHEVVTLLVVPWATGEDVTRKMLASVGRLPVNRMMAGDLRDDDWDKLGRAAGVLSGAPLFLSATRAQGPEMVERAVVELGARVGLIVVDSLSALLPPRRPGQLSVVARELKQLAVDRAVPLVVTGGVLAPAEGRNRVPVLSDLRGAGDIEDIADIVVLVHREDLDDAQTLRPGEADLVIAKSANGPTHTVTVAFQGHYSRFVDLAK